MKIPIAKRKIMHLKQLQEIRNHKIKQERQCQEEMEKKRKNINISTKELKDMLVLIIENMYTVKEMLNSKIKAAQTMGRIYVDPINMSDKNT